MNPSRSLGPAAISGHFVSYFWVYWVGPLCGGMLSVVYFLLLKALNYNSTVLDQDSDHEVKGLHPVHMRIYKFLAGHKDWERREHRQSERFMLVNHRKKAVNESGSTDFVESPVLVEVNRAHLHDEVLGPTEPRDHTATVENGLPLPVSMQART